MINPEAAVALPIPVLTTESAPGSSQQVQNYWTIWGEGRDAGQALSAISLNGKAQGAHAVVAVRVCTTVMHTSGTDFHQSTSRVLYTAYGTAVRYAT